MVLRSRSTSCLKENVGHNLSVLLHSVSVLFQVLLHENFLMDHVHKWRLVSHLGKDQAILQLPPDMLLCKDKTFWNKLLWLKLFFSTSEPHWMVLVPSFPSRRAPSLQIWPMFRGQAEADLGQHWEGRKTVPWMQCSRNFSSMWPMEMELLLYTACPAGQSHFLTP